MPGFRRLIIIVNHIYVLIQLNDGKHSFFLFYYTPHNNELPNFSVWLSNVVSVEFACTFNVSLQGEVVSPIATVCGTGVGSKSGLFCVM